MGKTKAKKHSTFIDMTAMSDVTVLLLTFFMLTATFLPKEPVRVNTPASVSEKKIPEFNVLTILIDTEGKVFLSMDRNDLKKSWLEDMGKDYGMTFTPAQVNTFVEQPFVGVPIGRMKEALSMPDADREDMMKQIGIPMDSLNDQFSRWIKHARTLGGEDLKIAIKADQSTPYPMVGDVMKKLVKLKENRYQLITILRGMPEV